MADHETLLYEEADRVAWVALIRQGRGAFASRKRIEWKLR
jgi:hypothetical protein